MSMQALHKIIAITFKQTCKLMYYWQSQTVIHVASATNILMSIVYLVTATVTLSESPSVTRCAFIQQRNSHLQD